MKYKVKIKCPGFNKGEIVESDKAGFVYSFNELPYIAISFPDVFEPIKEPLFVTEDGVEMFEGDNFWALDSFRKYVVNWFPSNMYDIYKNNLLFSSKESAESWIKENKPMFSIKQINEAIEKVESYGIESTVMLTSSFKLALGI